MWLTLDIGNSAIKGAVFAEDRLVQAFALPSEEEAAIEADLASHLAPYRIERTGIVSVVPPLTQRLAATTEAVTGQQAQIIGPEMRLPFAMGYTTPHTLGTDRLAAAAAAWTQHGKNTTASPRAVIALDAGTAITLDVVDRHGVYRGGTIGAGPALMRQALTQGTAQLPEVSLT